MRDGKWLVSGKTSHWVIIENDHSFAVLNFLAGGVDDIISELELTASMSSSDSEIRRFFPFSTDCDFSKTSSRFKIWFIWFACSSIFWSLEPMTVWRPAMTPSRLVILTL